MRTITISDEAFSTLEQLLRDALLATEKDDSGMHAYLKAVWDELHQ